MSEMSEVTGTSQGDGTTEIHQLVERCRDLHEDVHLEAVRRWKEGRVNPRAIGYLPVYIPAEAIHAVGALPVGIIGGGDRVEVIRGDAYFQSYICHLPRSTVELGVSGKLDVLDGMLFPAICDVIRNLSGVWQILFPDRLTRFVDFPQTFSPEVGGRFYRQQLLDLMEDITDLTGIPYSAERLRAALALYNENRWLTRALHELRVESPERVPTYEAYLIQRAGHLLPVEEHNDLLRRYLTLAADREAVPKTASWRLIRSLVRRLLSGGAENAAYFAYPRTRTARKWTPGGRQRRNKLESRLIQQRAGHSHLL